MKKIFGVLSLIAILTVAFTSQAIASDNDTEIVFSIGEYDAPLDAVAFEVVTVATDFAENVAVFPVNSTDLGGFLTSVPIDSGGFVNNFSTFTSNDNELFKDLPIDYGICSTSDIDLKEPLPNLTEYVNTYNTKYGYAEPDLVREIATNVGKLTRFTYNL